jgi:hypothetical protein
MNFPPFREIQYALLRALGQQLDAVLSHVELVQSSTPFISEPSWRGPDVNVNVFHLFKHNQQDATLL